MSYDKPLLCLAKKQTRNKQQGKPDFTNYELKTKWKPLLTKA